MPKWLILCDKSKFNFSFFRPKKGRLATIFLIFGEINAVSEGMFLAKKSDFTRIFGRKNVSFIGANNKNTLKDGSFLEGSGGGIFAKSGGRGYFYKYS